MPMHIICGITFTTAVINQNEQLSPMVLAEDVGYKKFSSMCSLHSR